MHMQHAHVIFYGKVQGVFFRANTQHKARQMGLVGSVRNLPDGRVEAFIQGPDDKVEELIRWCSTEMLNARVTRKDVEILDSLEDYTDFVLIRD